MPGSTSGIDLVLSINQFRTLIARALKLKVPAHALFSLARAPTLGRLLVDPPTEGREQIELVTMPHASG
ncbi:MAG: hypothetical protein DME33_08045 [Verrucomicrobia bacterium]|nr:MAG: hypothetical protein DME76_15170 [Verrucomicrobiota bacterium]PYL08129.1 MAG: hypothetical protein DME33_08045 [Verrucomicrobiota bacterium]